MKLKINSGFLDVEVMDGLSEIRKNLKRISEDSVPDKIRNAGVSPHSSLSNQTDSLNAKPRMPI